MGRKKAAKAKADAICQLKITLQGIKPPIWRRIQVDGNIRLSNLSDILLESMGWDNAHLHGFFIDGELWSEPDPNWDAEDESKIKLFEALPREGAKIVYQYDFGDTWLHDVLLEKILEPEAGARYPRCIDGKRACPPEDCGGIWGYQNLLEALADPTHEEHEFLSEWAGGDIDSEAFDVDETNRRLKRLQ